MVAGQSVSPQLWEEYGALQSKANRKKVDSYAWAIEEQLNRFLASIPGGLPSDSETRVRFLDNLLLNRTKKYSNRARLLEFYPAVRANQPSPEDIALHKLHVSETTARLRSCASPRDWKLLCGLAEGDSYQVVADREGITVAALKSRVCRCRQTLKKIAA